MDLDLCVMCQTHPVTIAVNSCGGGYCSPECEDSYVEEEDMEFDFDDTFADADALASAGWGTDEDYGYFGGDDY